jgi:hypothetical protein
LPDSSVSRRHAVVRLSDRVEIADLSSSNHTFVNETVVAGWRVLSPSDSFRLGAVKGTYEIGTASGADSFAFVPTSAIDATMGAAPVSDVLIGSVEYPGLIAEPGSHTPPPASTAAGDGAIGATNTQPRGAVGRGVNNDPELPLRRGWRLPVATTEPGGSLTSAPHRRSEASGPTPTLRGSVIGQVSQVTVGSTSANKSTEALVMLRLERHDPYAGRTSIYEVRIDGDELIGFASVGDWVEVTGRQKGTHIEALRCINHTTGAVYAPSAWRRHRMLVAALVFLSLVAVVATACVIVAHKADQAFHDNAKRDVQNQQELCLQSGAPPTLCRGLQ